MQARITNIAIMVPETARALSALKASAEKGGVPSGTLGLVELRASQINGCSVCVDMHARDLKKAGETDERLFAVSAWQDAPYFTDAERAALALTEAVTRLSDRSDPVPDTIWQEAARLFSCCHPDLSTEAQVTLILKTLCGFSVAEIAHALLTTEDSIEKRLGRARKLFRQAASSLEIPNASELPGRLEAVYEAIYLLFNEGYHGSQSEETVREDLCLEAIRLGLLLCEHPSGNRPRTHALVALMCFHAARLATRTDDEGSLIQLEVQDRSRWDPQLIERGFHYLEKASRGRELSAYHLEAGIAAVHCASSSYEQTDWGRIVDLYEELYRLKPSPIVGLNRAVATGNAQGPERGLEALNTIPDVERLKSYPFYMAAHGEFHLRAGRPGEAAKYFEEAMRLGRSPSEKSFFERRSRAAQNSSLSPIP